MLGPAADITGFEQGGINSSEFYKLYNNNQLETAQRSGLGVNIHSNIISAIGAADDVILAANNIDDLGLLAQLSEHYCARYRVTLVPSKTKLLPFFNKSQQHLINYAKIINPVKICGTEVQFVAEAENVAIVRSGTGNMPNILNRIASHKRAVGAVCSAGLARNHRANPAANIKVHQLYGTPVLFSGLGSLVLNSSEINIIAAHFKSTIQNCQKLHENTPRAVVFFMAGCLPAEAILHPRQLSLFS